MILPLCFAACLLPRLAAPLPQKIADPNQPVAVDSEFPEVPEVMEPLAPSILPTVPSAGAALPIHAKGIGIDLPDGPGRRLNFGVVLQPRLEVGREPAGTPGRALQVLPSLQRIRLQLSGSVHPRVGFMLQISEANVGLSNVWTPPWQALDAWVAFDLHRAALLQVGLFSLPFLHAGASGVLTLLGLDKPKLIFAQIPRIVDSQQIARDSGIGDRDIGLMLRGALVGKWLDYRLAVTQGMGKTFRGSPNLHALPRLTGRLTYNLFESITGPGARGYFLPGISLAERGGELISPMRALSLSLNASFQSKAIATATGPANFEALGADLYLDLPLAGGHQSLNGQVDYAWYRTGPGAAQSSHNLFVELGYRYRRIEPLVAWEFVHVPIAGTVDTYYARGGLNWWFAGHQANLKFDVGAQKILRPNNQVATTQIKANFGTNLMF